MSVVRIRVEAKNLHFNASQEEKNRSFRILLATFRRQVNDSGILTRYKEKQFFESKGEKRRRKQKAAELQFRKEQNNLQVRLRERFG